ncbi:hypothetical protein SLEP1_g6156 [Rubroshorea leprosula]|uniref:Uncharacterized protein n=1 Tax=Rubroshorea leprosula TaxID=152421 RepID=A0AAV5I526_9ROSI|nr:hypothetical protein SLEP1_g6156 [Rubroshorea leprosula]
MCGLFSVEFFRGGRATNEGAKDGRQVEQWLGMEKEQWVAMVGGTWWLLMDAVVWKAGGGLALLRLA